MKKIFITQRSETFGKFNEKRDNLDVRFSLLFKKLNIIPILIPNNTYLARRIIMNIKPNGITGIINGLTSITPLKKTLRLFFMFKKAFIRSNQYDKYELVFLFQTFRLRHVDVCDENEQIQVSEYY